MNSPAIRLQRHHAYADWLRFLAWVAAGFAVAFGMLVVGPLALAGVVFAAALLVFLPASRRGALGLLSGVGAVSLVVAYVQRKGPGTVTWHTATASGSDQYLDPRPWLIAGIVLVVAGLAGHAWRTTRRQRSVHE